MHCVAIGIFKEQVKGVSPGMRLMPFMKPKLAFEAAERIGNVVEGRG